MIRPVRPMIIVETGLMLLSILAFLRVYSLFMSNGYLSAPFVFDVGDTFMDWFNTAYWAHNGNAYSVWQTIYLPLSFVITKFFGNSRCYTEAPYDARDCDVFGIGFIIFMYVTCVVVTAMALWRSDPKTALFRTIAIALGGPLLYALERGQLLMLTYISMVAIYGNLVRGRFAYALSAGFMANTKVYMVLPLFELAVKRKWRLFELCAIASLGIYLVTLLIIGEGTPFEIATNLQNWFTVRLGTIWDEMLYTTTYKPLLQLDVRQYPVRDYVEQRYVDAGMLFVNIYVFVTRLGAFFCIALAWLYPRTITTNRLVFFILMQSFIGQNPGGYSLVLVSFLVFSERAKNSATIIAIVCAYLMSFAGDVTLTKLFDFERISWLSQRLIVTEYVVPWGALIRPGVIAIMLWALIIDSLITFHRAMRRERPIWGLAGRDAPEAPPPAPREVLS